MVGNLTLCACLSVLYKFLSVYKLYYNIDGFYIIMLYIIIIIIIWDSFRQNGPS